MTDAVASFDAEGVSDNSRFGVEFFITGKTFLREELLMWNYQEHICLEGRTQ